jgi:hypothetical protein
MFTGPRIRGRRDRAVRLACFPVVLDSGCASAQVQLISVLEVKTTREMYLSGQC